MRVWRVCTFLFKRLCRCYRRIRQYCTTKKITVMKKFYLFVLLLVSAVSANAQTFDEADLVGSWTTTGLSYAQLGITKIENITLGAGLYTRNDRTVYTNGLITVIDEERDRIVMERVPDYYITNNNKLHIWLDDSFALQFIIEELTPTTLKVRTYDGQSYSFTKDSSSSAVQSVSVTRPADESTYNLSGQKVENITADGIYIQNGQKRVVKR